MTTAARNLATMTLLGCLTLIGVPLASAQDEPAFKLRWFGQSFFQLETPGGKRVVFDPHNIPEFGRAIVRADIILQSHLHSDHTQITAVEDYKAARIFPGLKAGKSNRTTDWNRVDESVGKIHIRSVPTYHDTEEGMTRGKNSAWIVEAHDVVFCHLGDLGHELTDSQIKAIGPVDVLMIPVGGIYTINGSQAKRVVEQLKPKRFIIPMHYAVPNYDELLSADEFLDEQPNVKNLTDRNELVIPVEAKNAPPAIVLLGWKPKAAP
ncbi:MAG: MBL fold metallo-hydrolase [Bacteroidales bacterium]|nr:MBL fold metallo-hydrolase [Bacteroidales bacterium]